MAKEGKTDRFHDKFPTRLRGLIEEKGVTQVTLASLLGISRQSFSAYCDGSTQPNIENTIKIANFFGVSVDYLFGLSDIRTTDPATKSLCETLGLCEEAVSYLQKGFPYHNTELNVLLTSQYIDEFLMCMNSVTNAAAKLIPLERTLEKLKQAHATTDEIAPAWLKWRSANDEYDLALFRWTKTLLNIANEIKAHATERGSADEEP